MLYRLAGIRHTNYRAARQLFPVPFDRWLLIVVLVLAIAAPFYLSPLHLNSYLMPWVIWATAALGLNLLMGWAGQVHLGYAAVMAIGAYTAIHAVRAGVPFELALMVGGLASSVIGLAFGAAALRVKGLYLAVTTLAMQSVVDWTIVHVPAISGGSQATLQAPVMRVLGQPVLTDWGRYWLALVVCAVGHELPAQHAAHQLRPRAGRRTREGFRRGHHRGQPVQVQAAGVLVLVLHRRRGGRGPCLLLLSGAHA